MSHQPSSYIRANDLLIEKKRYCWTKSLKRRVQMASAPLSGGRESLFSFVPRTEMIDADAFILYRIRLLL